MKGRWIYNHKLNGRILYHYCTYCGTFRPLEESRRCKCDEKEWPTETWDCKTKSRVTIPKEMKAFLQEIEDVCRRHNKSIGHEDREGSFIVEEYESEFDEWLSWAHKNY